MDDASEVAPIFAQHEATRMPDELGQPAPACQHQSKYSVADGTALRGKPFSLRGYCWGQQNSRFFQFPSIANQSYRRKEQDHESNGQRP
jgi:hypothetical protein